YALGDERSHLWVVTVNSINSYELPKRSEIDPLARRLYQLVTLRNVRPSNETTEERMARLTRGEVEYSDTATRLSQMLLGPAASLLGSKRIVVVADGALQYLPFASLPDPNAIVNKRI